MAGQQTPSLVRVLGLWIKSAKELRGPALVRKIVFGPCVGARAGPGQDNNPVAVSCGFETPPPVSANGKYQKRAKIGQSILCMYRVGLCT